MLQDTLDDSLKHRLLLNNNKHLYVGKDYIRLVTGLMNFILLTLHKYITKIYNF